jgi:hypothetical protein
MAFSEYQLETWSSQGAIVSSATTYNSIKTCIDEVNWNEDISYKIYLKVLIKTLQISEAIVM